MAVTQQFNAVSRQIWEKYSTIRDRKINLDQLALLHPIEARV
jgi:hypothetical protein